MASIGLTRNELDQFIISEVRGFIRNGFVPENNITSLNEKVYGLAGGYTTVETKPWVDSKTENILKNIYKLKKIRREGQSDEETKLQPGIYVLPLAAGSGREDDTLRFEDSQRVFSYANDRMMGYRAWDTGVQLFSSQADAKGSGKDLVGKIIFKKSLASATDPGKAFYKVDATKLKQQKQKEKQEVEKDWFEAGTWSNMIGHTLLDVAGFINIYGIGPTADFLNAFWYLQEDEYFYAALSVLAMIPGSGEMLAGPLKLLFKTGVTILKEVGSIGKAISEILWYIYAKIHAGPVVIDFIRDQWHSLQSIVANGFKALNKSGNLSGTDVGVLIKAINDALTAGGKTLDDIYKAADEAGDASAGTIPGRTPRATKGGTASLTNVPAEVLKSSSSRWSYLNSYVRRWSSLTFDASAKEASNIWQRGFSYMMSKNSKIIKYPGHLGSWLAKMYSVATPVRNVMAIEKSMKRAFNIAVINSFKQSRSSGSIVKLLDSFAKPGTKLSDLALNFNTTIAKNAELAKNYATFVSKPYINALKNAQNIAAKYQYNASKIAAKDLKYVEIQVKNSIRSIGGFNVKTLSMQDFFDLLKPNTPSSPKWKDIGLHGKDGKELLYSNMDNFYKYLSDTPQGGSLLEDWVRNQMTNANPIYIEYMIDPLNKIRGSIFKQAGDFGTGTRDLFGAWIADSRKWATMFTRNLSATVQIATDTGIAGDEAEKGNAPRGSSDNKMLQAAYDAVNWLENDPQSQQSLIGMFYLTHMKTSKTIQNIEDVKDDMVKDAKKLLGPQENRDVY